jgi:three-Cys-motif partner protein
MADQRFFDEARAQSLVKMEIVRKYFGAWATAIIPPARKRGFDHIAYLDLFCGPGRYLDGTDATPLLIMRRVADEERLRDFVEILFNDKDKEFVANLRHEIDAFPEIDKFRFKPKVANAEVGQKMIDVLKRATKIPTLLFADPCGYKGLSLALIATILPYWGCDCILFFNYNRINAAVNNPVFAANMADLFGEERLRGLLPALDGLSPNDRELVIIERISEALHELGGEYVLPFRFVTEGSDKVSHHIIFVSKNVLGYKIMKDIMAKYATSEAPGLGSFQYNPSLADQPVLAGYALRIDDLKYLLPVAFQGKTLTMQEIYQQHNVGTPFIEADYKQVLVELEAEGKISTTPAASKRPKRNGKPTFADKVMVSFSRI